MKVQKISRLASVFLVAVGMLAGFISADLVSRSASAVTVANTAIAGQPSTSVTSTASSSVVHLYFFGREDCHNCQLEKKFVDQTFAGNPEVEVVFFDTNNDPAAKDLFDRITTANGLSKVTPLTLVGGKIIQGYDSDSTTGETIKRGVEQALDGKDFNVEYYTNLVEVLKGGAGCDESSGALICKTDTVDKNDLAINVPFLGVIHPEEYSLFTLASILGLIDGFNPCAMWVLVTFLLILMQIGDRKKMLYTAGLFLVAEAVMYYMILTAWYKTWDFIGLDKIVTPLVGALALGSGFFFLWRWYRSRNKPLTCDITSFEQQNTIEKKIRTLIQSPMTLGVAVGIIGIALSVNIIEFACSIGIPQVFTKVLELNKLSFWSYQWYMFVYIVGYMADDIVVFGFALWGIDKMYASEKYSKISTLVGGVLMLLLGVMLIAFPNILVF